jgi:hypothetical protein
VAKDHAEDRDGPHGVDHRVAVAHDTSPIAMRANVFSDSLPVR